MEANTKVFSFKVTFKFFKYIDEPGSAWGLRALSRYRLDPSPLNLMAALSLTLVNFRSSCICVKLVRTKEESEMKLHYHYLRKELVFFKAMLLGFFF